MLQFFELAGLFLTHGSLTDPIRLVRLSIRRTRKARLVRLYTHRSMRWLVRRA